MSETHKSALLSSLFALYSRNLIRRRFHSLNVSGLSHLADATSRLPLIIYCNHSSWWDGIIVFQMMRMAELDGFVIMEDLQLDSYPLFKRFGAIPISRRNPRQAFLSLKSIANLVAETESGAVTIFPQGKLVPNETRPLVFETGIARLIKYTGVCETLCIAIQFRFGSHFKPEIFVRIGSRRRFSTESASSPGRLTDELRQELTVHLDELTGCITTGARTGFTKLI